MFFLAKIVTLSRNIIFQNLTHTHTVAQRDDTMCFQLLITLALYLCLHRLHVAMAIEDYGMCQVSPSFSASPRFPPSPSLFSCVLAKFPRGHLKHRIHMLWIVAVAQKLPAMLIRWQLGYGCCDPTMWLNIFISSVYLHRYECKRTWPSNSTVLIGSKGLWICCQCRECK